MTFFIENFTLFFKQLTYESQINNLKMIQMQAMETNNHRNTQISLKLHSPIGKINIHQSKIRNTHQSAKPTFIKVKFVVVIKVSMIVLMY